VLTLNADVTIKKGQTVSGPGIAAGTTVEKDVTNAKDVKIDKVTTAAIQTTDTITFSTKQFIFTSKNCLANAACEVKVGQKVTGTGIAADTKVVQVDTSTGVVELDKSITADLSSTPVTFKTDTIKLNVDALATGIKVNDTITTVVTGTNPIQAGTIVSAINGA
jgi:hypothetical protein